MLFSLYSNKQGLFGNSVSYLSYSIYQVKEMMGAILEMMF